MAYHVYGAISHIIEWKTSPNKDLNKNLRSRNIRKKFAYAYNLQVYLWCDSRGRGSFEFEIITFYINRKVSWCRAVKVFLVSLYSFHCFFKIGYLQSPNIYNFIIILWDKHHSVINRIWILMVCIYKIRKLHILKASTKHH